VERPEDDELRKSFEAAQAAENPPPLGAGGVQRKPLPNTPYANYPASRRPPTPPKSYPHFQPPSDGSQNETQAEKYSNRGSHLRLNTSDPSRLPIARKPVGARIMPGYSTSPASSYNMNSASPLDNGQGRTEFPDQSTNRCSPVRSSPHSAFPEVPLDALRITLIRRDPASGNQWNVGNIVIPGAPNREASLQHFEMELTTPGYGRFAQNEGATGRPFQRKTGYMLIPNSEPTPGGNKRSNSTELLSTAASATSRKPRQAYSFLSPWQGMCSFSNAIDGRSLRCRHMLPAANSSMPALSADIAELRFNLPWAKLTPRDTNRQQNDSLHLPNSGPSRPSMSKDHQWRKSLSNFTHKAREQLSKYDGLDSRASLDTFTRGSNDVRGNSQDEERMNLDLGREKAGGGFKGHSAKLGKLIIEDEGLKMCDLVVAVCMGVWWQHYSGDMAG